MSNEYLNNKFLEGAISRFQNSKTEKAKYELILLQMRKFPDKAAKKAAHGLSVDQCQVEYDRLVREYSESQAMLATAFYTLSENIVRYAKFNLIDIDDAIQEGVMICFEKIDRFNPEIGKAFNYMTTCILNHFRQLYRTARNYNELKKKYHDFLQAQNENQVPRRPKDKTSKGTSRVGNSD
jgi:RNA polymerase sigma factor (sigma-70 family)